MDKNKSTPIRPNFSTTENLSNSSKPKFAWHRSAGVQVIESVDFYIGDQKIEPELQHK